MPRTKCTLCGNNSDVGERSIHLVLEHIDEIEPLKRWVIKTITEKMRNNRKLRPSWKLLAQHFE